MFHGAVQVTTYLGARAGDVERWSRGETPGELLKDNHGRKVWRVPTGAGALYVKRFPSEFFRDRARKEAAMLQALEGAGIPCPRLVAVARDASGSYLLTEEIPGVEVLSAIMDTDAVRARKLLEPLGQLTRRLHDAGFEHQDFHAGNILVRDGALFVIDVHRARFLKKLSKSARLDNLAFMAMSFVERLPATALVRYFRACGLRARPDWIEAWTRLRERHERYFRGRSARCLKEGTGFGISGSLYYRKEIEPDQLLARIRSGPRAVVKNDAGECVSRVDRTIFLKETKPLRAKRIWKNSHGLEVRGIETPRLWAWKKSWVAGEWVEGLDLHAYVIGPYGALPRAERDAFLFRLARLVRRMHDRGVYHGDLKAGNVMVSGERILVVDLDRVSFSLDVPRERRIFNLAQLNAAVTVPLTRGDRLRFLRAYFGRCRTLARERKRWVEAIMRATVARAHRWPPR